MFRPNNTCRIQLNSGLSDLYGQPKPGVWVSEPCSVVRLTVSNQPTSVRTDSSASHGAALEAQATSTILLTVGTKANRDDVVEVAGVKLRLMGMEPRFDAAGVLNHYQATLTIWSAK